MHVGTCWWTRGRGVGLGVHGLTAAVMAAQLAVCVRESRCQWMATRGCPPCATVLLASRQIARISLLRPVPLFHSRNCKKPRSGCALLIGSRPRPGLVHAAPCALCPFRWMLVTSVGAAQLLQNNKSPCWCWLPRRSPAPACAFCQYRRARPWGECCRVPVAAC